MKKDRDLIKKIENSLKNNPAAVVRALELLYENQTDDEKMDKETKHHNGVGFSGCDARTGSWLVEVVIAEGREKGLPEKSLLRGKALEMGYRIALRYSGTQLLRAAEEKREVERKFYRPPTPREMQLVIEANLI